MDSPEPGGNSERFTLRVHRIDRGAGWQDANDKVLVVARPPIALVERRSQPYFRYGDVLELEGRLERPQPFADFGYPAYLARQDNHTILSFPQVQLLEVDQGNLLTEVLHNARRGAATHLNNAVPARQAALAQALLLGKRSTLTGDVREDFRESGTSHLLAVSGLHVGVVLFLTAGAGAYLLGRRRHLYLLVPLAAIWGYAALTGMAPPVQRAAIMGSVYLCALALGRPRSHLPALLLAGSVLAGLEPCWMSRSR